MTNGRCWWDEIGALAELASRARRAYTRAPGCMEGIEMGSKRFNESKGPSQRQLRAGELVRHALVDILAREGFRDPALESVMISVTEVRPSPDLRSAKVYVAPLGGGDAKSGAASSAGASGGSRRGMLKRSSPRVSGLRTASSPVTCPDSSRIRLNCVLNCRHSN